MGQPAALNWVSRRNNYNALDEAAFANEYFTPEYLESFATLDEKTRCDLLAEQKMTSDGVTCESLLAIYRAMYHRFEVLREKPWAQLLPSRSVTRVTSQAQGQRLSLRHHLDGGQETLDTDVVIFATGYRPARPAFLARWRIGWSWTNAKASGLIPISRWRGTAPAQTIFLPSMPGCTASALRNPSSA
ncbi:SidA/IucD/PvdA family monooxygenase [Cronobacter sakazakii]|uniref:SidA/IucD/PvdA family monooxygenase n=1 Tax=Cronobacter sakazakii TaxID=28141 RepID=UPI00308180A3